jgi:hypothetical protein
MEDARKPIPDRHKIGISGHSAFALEQSVLFQDQIHGKQ